MVLPTTVQSVTLAAVVMMIISLIFIPNPLCSLWVAFSIVSIELGVLGFMTLWRINLVSYQRTYGFLYLTYFTIRL